MIGVTFSALVATLLGMLDAGSLRRLGALSLCLRCSAHERDRRVVDRPRNLAGRCPLAPLGTAFADLPPHAICPRARARVLIAEPPGNHSCRPRYLSTWRFSHWPVRKGTLSNAR